MVTPHSCNFRIITAILGDYRIFSDIYGMMKIFNGYEVKFDSCIRRETVWYFESWLATKSS